MTRRKSVQEVKCRIEDASQDNKVNVLKTKISKKNLLTSR